MVRLGVVAYMARVNNISLSIEPNYSWFILSNTFEIDPLLLVNYSVVDLNLKHYKLLKKNTSLPAAAVVIKVKKTAENAPMTSKEDYYLKRF